VSEAQRRTFHGCHRCIGATVHTLICSEESDFRHCDAEGFFHHEPATYSVFRCDGCTEISVYIWSAFHNPESEFGQSIYPPRVAEEAGIPDLVRRAYLEAEALRRHSNSAYVVLARKVLEIIARDRGVTERNLSRSLSVLVERGEIPPLLAEAATFIRIFGNTGAHSSEDNITGIHVEMIEKFLEVLVQYIYVAPAALRDFKTLLEIEDNDAMDA
jgi:Domain of unknown function (DUF4145)